MRNGDGSPAKAGRCEEVMGAEEDGGRVCGGRGF